MSDIIPVTYRIPMELKEKLDQSAVDNNRSANAELVHRLTESLNNTGHESDGDIHSKLDKIYIAILEQSR